jgi:hypothetical protein
MLSLPKCSAIERDEKKAVAERVEFAKVGARGRRRATFLQRKILGGQ